MYDTSLSTTHSAVVLRPHQFPIKKEGLWSELPGYKVYWRATYRDEIVCSAGAPFLSLNTARTHAQSLANKMCCTVEDRT